MPCDHVGPQEVIEMAEGELCRREVPVERWPGTKFGYAENLTGGMWAAIRLEVERRGDEWAVTRLDRLREPLPRGETGFVVLTPPTA
jgi:hypothetical protein